MKKPVAIYVVVLALFLSLFHISVELSPLLRNKTASIKEQQFCLSEFEDFFKGPWSRENIKFIRNPNAPLAFPWQLVIPRAKFEEKHYISLKLVQQKKNARYIWLSSLTEFHVYNETQNHWQRIPKTIHYANATLDINKIIELQNGDIIGINSIIIQNNTTSNIDADGLKFPLLSKYDELSNSFSPLLTLFHSVDPDYNEKYFSVGILELENSLLIGVPNDALYQYDYLNDQIDEIVALPDVDVYQLYGKRNLKYLYITTVHNPFRDSSLTPKLFVLGDLFRVDLATKAVEKISFPIDKIPYTSNILIDHRNFIWYGWFGYFHSDGIWVGNTKEINEYLVDGRLQDIQIGTPKIFLEDSKNHLWYVRDNESFYDGSAWYDPITKTGCQVTISSIIEKDKSGNLWVINGYGLYVLKTENQ
ncbi:MAG TPA: hypothetical protein PK299_14940 [Anaerolineales bacterium]|nr:hypothetical protein [Anaerolineales bacterium]